MRRLMAAATLALAAAIGTAGCGRTEEPPRPADAAPAETTAGTAAETTAPAAEPSAMEPSAVEPCSLVSKAAAEKVAGTRLQDAVAVRETCTYTAPVTGPTAQVEVFVGDGAKKFLDIDRDLGHDLKPVSGVGDEAYQEDGAVFLRKAEVWVAIRVTRLDDPATYRAALGRLARDVADRL